MIRRRLPWLVVRIGVAGKGKKDCGCHEWYRHDEYWCYCYHCDVGEAKYADVLG